MSKTACPVTRQEFLAAAAALYATISHEDGTLELSAEPKQFSTGSVGWTISARLGTAPFAVTVAGQSFELGADRQFSTGSTGRGAQGKVGLSIGGVMVPCQVGINATVIGSGRKAKAYAGSYQLGINVTAIGSKDLAA